MPTSLEPLEELTLQAYGCEACKLCQTRTTVVFGDGNPNADIIFIGEAPGEQEDESGIPFVGRSGQLLSKMLDVCLGLTRDDVYIANIVKCRPPENRDPEGDEIVACLGYLKKQIQIIQPRVLVTLGRFATQALLETEERIGKLRGKEFVYEGIPLVPSWHPSYLLRRPMSRNDTVKDMKIVQEILAKPLT